MKEHKLKEWFFPTKFGKLAMISRGEPSLPGVLMVHGFRDSAATFLPLLALLPDTHYYVTFDFPGHGHSDYVDTVQLFSQALIPELMKDIVDHLGWKSFVCLSHSVGVLIANVFHHVFPGRIRRMINFDPVYGLIGQYFAIHEPTNYVLCMYQLYYDNLRKSKILIRSYDEFVSLTMKDRGLSRELAEIVLSRSLTPVGNGKYRQTMQPTMVRLLNIPADEMTLQYIYSCNILPTLNFHGILTEFDEKVMNFGLGITKFYKPHQKNVFIDAYHDLHITHAEELVPHIEEFLKQDIQAKL